MLGEGDRVVMRVRVVRQPQGGDERMRFGDGVQRFEIGATVGEAEGLPPAIGTFGREGHVRRGPLAAALRVDAPARRHAVLEYFQPQHTVAGVDAMRFGAVAVRLTRCGAQPFAAGAQDHPAGDGDDEDGRDDLEIRLGGRRVPLAAQPHAHQRDRPDHDGVREGGRQPQQDRLRHGAAHGNDEGRHHRLAVAGFQPMQGAEQDRRRHEQPGVGGVLLQQPGERRHRRPQKYWPTCPPTVAQTQGRGQR